MHPAYNPHRFRIIVSPSPAYTYFIAILLGKGSSVEWKFYIKKEYASFLGGRETFGDMERIHMNEMVDEDLYAIPET